MVLILYTVKIYTHPVTFTAQMATFDVMFEISKNGFIVEQVKGEDYSQMSIY